MCSHKLDLVVHVGMPKTATTSYQVALSGYPGYVGRNGSLSKYTKSLLKIFGIYSEGGRVERKLLRWAKSLVVHAKRKRHEGPLIVSDELFFASEFNKMLEFPLVSKGENVDVPKIAGFLALIREVCGIYISSVCCVLSIRNQIDWLFSKYSEASLKIEGASMRDFIEKINEFSSNNNYSWCNWFWWVDALDNAIGRENVHVLLMEDINLEGFAEEFKFAFALDKTHYDVISLHENRKSHGGQDWTLRSFDSAAFHVKKMGLIPGTLRYMIVFRFIRFLSLFSLNKKAQQPSKLTATEEAKGIILEKCVFDNARLAKRLGKDLLDYGCPF